MRSAGGARRPRLAFVNQPFSRLELPLKSDSLGIWTHHVAQRCAARADVSVYAHALGPDAPSEEWHEGVRYRRIEIGADQRVTRLAARLARGREKLGAPRPRRRPFFASGWHFLVYAARIALDARRHDVDVVHVHNFSQFVPVLKALHPRGRVVLDMQCEWLTTLDRELLQPRVEAADLILGCSRFIAENVRARFGAAAEPCRVLHSGVEQDWLVQAPPPWPCRRAAS